MQDTILPYRYCVVIHMSPAKIRGEERPEALLQRGFSG